MRAGQRDKRENLWFQLQNCTLVQSSKHNKSRASFWAGNVGRRANEGRRQEKLAKRCSVYDSNNNNGQQNCLIINCRKEKQSSKKQSKLASEREMGSVESARWR